MPLCCQGTAGSCSAYCPADLKVPFHRAAPQLPVPSPYHCKGFFLPTCRNLHTPSMNFIRFLLVHFSSLSRSLWRAALTLSTLTGPPQFGVIYRLDESALWCLLSTDLMRVHSGASSRSLIKTVTRQVPGQTLAILHSLPASR